MLQVIPLLGERLIALVLLIILMPFWQISGGQPHFGWPILKPAKHFLATLRAIGDLGHIERHGSHIGIGSPKAKSGHACAHCCAHRDPFRGEIFKAEDIDADKVRRHALAVEWIYPAGLAEEVPRGVCMELIFGQAILAAQQFKLAFMHLDHQRVLAATDRTVACRQFRKIGSDPKGNRTAMAAAAIIRDWSVA